MNFSPKKQLDFFASERLPFDTAYYAQNFTPQITVPSIFRYLNGIQIDESMGVTLQYTFAL